MSLKQALRRAETLFVSRNISDARIEAELLLMHSLGIDKVGLYTGLERPLSSPEADKFRCLVERRLRHEPTAYILKQCQFYGIDVYIDSRALIPRPESEMLVQIALEFASQHFPPGAPCSLADVGTGSGAIAIALAWHLRHSRVYAMDISAEALEVARINRQRHAVEEQVDLLLGDTLDPLPEPVNIIVANLPYVRDADLSQLMPEIRDFEPLRALAGGPDGLDKVRRLLLQAKDRLLPGGLMLLEIGQGQAAEVRRLAKASFPDAEVDMVRDLAGIDRVLRVLI